MSKQRPGEGASPGDEAGTIYKLNFKIWPKVTGKFMSEMTSFITMLSLFIILFTAFIKSHSFFFPKSLAIKIKYDSNRVKGYFPGK